MEEQVRLQQKKEEQRQEVLRGIKNQQDFSQKVREEAKKALQF